MVGFDIERIRNFLSSSKIRERNEGLNLLDDVNLSSRIFVEQLTPKILYSLLESLHFCISHDIRVFSSGSSSSATSCESRLHQASSFFRTLVQVALPHYVHKFKNSAIEAIFRFARDGSCSHKYEHGRSLCSIIEPTAYNLILSLHELLTLQSLKDHLKNSEYIKTIEFTLRVLGSLSSSESLGNEKYFTILFQIYNTFLSPQYTSGLIVLKDKAYSQEILDIICDFKGNMTDLSRRGTQSLIHIFRILNSTLVSMSLVDIKMCHRIYLIGTRFIVDLDSVHQPLKAEISLFINVSSPFISVAKLPKIMGDDWNFDSNGRLRSSNGGGDHGLADKRESSVSSVDSISTLNDTDILFQNSGQKKDNNSNDLQVNTLKDLRLMINKLLGWLLDISGVEQFGLLISEIEINQFPDSTNVGFFDLRFFSRRETDDTASQKWLMRQGICNLLREYYEMKALSTSRNGNITNLETEYNDADMDTTTGNISSHDDDFGFSLPTPGRQSKDRRSHSQHANKRRRVSLGYTTGDLDSWNLSNFDTSLEFLLSLSSGTSNVITSTTALQLLLFLIADSACFSNLNSQNRITYKLINDSNSFIEQLLKLFEAQDESIDSWVLLILFTLFSILAQAERTEIIPEIKSSHVQKIIRYSLQMIKSESLCRPTCSLLSVVLRSGCDKTSNIVDLSRIDRTLITQFETLIDLAEINGPSILCKESTLFWFSVAELCKLFSFKSIKLFNSTNTQKSLLLSDPNLGVKLLSQKLSNWILSKWDQLQGIEYPGDIHLISLFIKWISGYKNVELQSRAEINQVHYIGVPLLKLWEEQSYARQYILLQLYQGENNILLRSVPFLRPPVLGIDTYMRRKVITEYMTDLKVLAHSSSKTVALYWLSNMSLSADHLDSRDDQLLESFNNVYDNILTSEIESLSLFFGEDVISRSSVTSAIAKLNAMNSTDDSSLFTREGYSGINLDYLTRLANFEEKDTKLEFEFSHVDDEVMNKLVDPYKLFNLNFSGYVKTDLQIITRFLFRHYIVVGSPDVLIKNSVNKSIHKVLSFIARANSPVKQFICLYELSCLFEEHDITELLPTDLESLVGMLISLLDSYELHVFEMAIVTISKLLIQFSATWLENEADPIHIDCIDILDYLVGLYNSDLLHSRISLVALVSLQLSLYLNPKRNGKALDDVKLTEPAYSILRDMGPDFVVHIAKYLTTSANLLLTYENYQDALSFFVEPQESVEHSALFNLCMSELISTSYHLTLSCIFSLLKFATFPHFERYFSYSFNHMSTSSGYQSRTKLFEAYALSILRHLLVQRSLTLKDMPISSFGYPTLSSFVRANYKQITAIVMVFSEHPGPLLNTISSRIKMSPSTIILACFPQIMAIAYAESKQDFIFDRLSTTYITSTELDSCGNKYQAMIVLELFKLCGTDDESESRSLSSKTLESDRSLFFSISSVNLTGILKLILRSSNSNHFSFPSGLFFFVSSRLLLTLKDDTSYHKEYKLMVLRRLQLLIKLSRDKIETTQVSSLYVNSMVKLLGDPDLSNDASDILLEVLRRSSSSVINISKHEPYSIQHQELWILTIHELININKSSKENEWYTQLVTYLDDSTKDTLSQGGLTDLIHCGVEYLRKSKTCLPMLLVSALLDWLSVVGIDYELNVLRLISSLFGLMSPSELASYNTLRLSAKSIDYLFSIRVFSTEFSTSFNAFIGRALGCHYSRTGQVSNYTESKYAYNFDEYKDGFNQKVSSLDMLFKRIIDDNRKFGLDVVPLTSMYTIIGSLVYTKNLLGAESLEGIVSNGVFSEFESHALAIDPQVCPLLNEVSENNTYFLYGDSLAQFIVQYENISAAKSPEDWLLRMFYSVTTDIKSKSPILTLFADYVSKNEHFVYKALPHLVLYYIHCTNSKGNLTMVRLIKGFFSSDIKCLPLEVIRLFLEIVLLVRVGSLNLSKKFENVYDKLDKMCISRAAYHAGCPKTSLLFFEEYHSESTVKEGLLWHKDSDFLYDLYSQIDVDDLMFGLPVHPVLAHGLGAMKNQNYEEVRTFNTSGFNAALSMGLDIRSNASEILDGFVADGQLGVSKVMGEFLGNSFEKTATNDQEYETSWKLNQWDLPSSNDFNSENKVIYQTLSDLRKLGESNSMIVENMISSGDKSMSCIFDRSFSSLLADYDNFGNFRESRFKDKLLSWFRTLATVSNIESVTQYSDTDVDRRIEEYVEDSAKWYTNEDFKRYENIILARKAVWELEDHSCSLSRSLRHRLIVTELNRYSELAGASKNYQKQVNSAVYLNSFIEKNLQKSDEFYRIAQRLATFDLASSIWNQKDQSTLPVAMLASIVEEADFSPQNTQQSFTWVNTLPSHYVNAVIAKWSAESSQMTTENIMSNYIKPIVEKMTKSNNETSKDSEIYYMFAEFCDSQIKIGVFDRTAETLQKSLRQKQKEMTQLESYVRDKSNSKEERKNASRVYMRLDVSFKRDKEELKICMENKASCIEQAISHYISTLCLDQTHDETAIDRFCALWMEYSDTPIDDESLMKVPGYKFVPWVSQLMSRLSKDKRGFQNILGDLLFKLCLSHPYHTLYILFSLRMTNKSDDALALNRSTAANAMWNQVSVISDSRRVDGGLITSKIFVLCKSSVDLANEKLSRTKEKISLKNLKTGGAWLKEIPESQTVMPTVSIPIDKTCEYPLLSLPLISSISSYITLAASGISVPKIMKMTLSNGMIHKVLFKGGGDDLRQDAIMEQVFEKVNNLLNKNQETRSRGLSVRTYKVVPLGTGCGVIEFVTGTVSLDKILNELHSNDELSISQARAMMKQVQTKTTLERVMVYRKITSMIHPMMHRFFLINFFSPDLWLTNRINYSRGMAVNSIVGHILGLGDRHNNNILLDFHTCEPVHIDLGIAFDQGKALAIPELIPFRLTREIVDGLGITGINGVYSKACEKTFQILRDNSQYISGILDVLKYDPLYSWSISPIRKKRIQEQLLNDDDDDISFVKYQNAPSSTPDHINKASVEEEGSEASIAINGVLNKLEAKNLSSEVVVRDLIRQATDEKNLALLFLGWCPFL